MNRSTWQWELPRRRRAPFAGLTPADIPALMLAGVSAVTVTAGARLLRGQNSMLMLMLGIGVAGATFVLDKMLVDRLGSIKPRQSLPALLTCWTPLFLFATSLATVATFSWIVPQIAKQDLDNSRRAHWTHQAGKVSSYLVAVRGALKRHAEATQQNLESERRRATAAKQSNQPYDAETIRQLQRRLVVVRDVDRRLPVVQPLPLEAPALAPAADDQMARAFREIGDVHAAVSLALTNPPPLPAYEPWNPPDSDVQSVLAEETQKRSWRAMVAWGSALWVELLPLLALWRGGRRIPLATRVMNWRLRWSETMDAIRGRRVPTALPIMIEPLQVRGVVRIALPGDYTLTDCTPLLEQAVGTLTEISGAYQLNRVSTAHGEAVDETLPLLPQLGGQPLILSVVEGHA
jgi:hypothetical protein